MKVVILRRYVDTIESLSRILRSSGQVAGEDWIITDNPTEALAYIRKFDGQRLVLLTGAVFDRGEETMASDFVPTFKRDHPLLTIFLWSVMPEAIPGVDGLILHRSDKLSRVATMVSVLLRGDFDSVESHEIMEAFPDLFAQ